LVEHDAQSIADAVADLLANPAKREAIVTRARAGVEQYGLPAVTARYDRLFQELAA
jgi:glycosyltransferase involved in cell wall biosynthesis